MSSLNVLIGDKVPDVNIIHLAPSASNSCILYPGHKHQKYKVLPLLLSCLIYT